MHVSLHSANQSANHSQLVRVEASFLRGFSGMQVIGNLSETCRDSKERARGALEGLGIHLPPRRILVSLTPAETKKEGAQFDLAFAIVFSLLVNAKDRLPVIDPRRWLFAAEVGIDGSLKPVRSIVSFALAALSEGLTGMVVAHSNLRELRALGKLGQQHTLATMGFTHIKEVLDWLYSGAQDSYPVDQAPLPKEACEVNFDDMHLSEPMQQLAMVCATGRHNLLLRGVPGCGKSMFAERLVSLLPDLEPETHLEALRIHSLQTKRLDTPLLSGRPPQRGPHHHASASAVLGHPEHPGEISLAHAGVLFLDELPEFRRDVLEGLREPLELGRVQIARTQKKVTWPANVLLIAACNNCPCGWLGSRVKTCHCSTNTMARYANRLSGPILDRIDLHAQVEEPPLSADQWLTARAGNSGQTKRMRAQVEAALVYGEARNRSLGCRFNSELPASTIIDALGIDSKQLTRMLTPFKHRLHSRRQTLRALRVARTLADLAQREALTSDDLSRAAAWQVDENCLHPADLSTLPTAK